MFKYGNKNFFLLKINFLLNCNLYNQSYFGIFDIKKMTIVHFYSNDSFLTQILNTFKNHKNLLFKIPVKKRSPKISIVLLALLNLLS